MLYCSPQLGAGPRYFTNQSASGPCAKGTGHVSARPALFDFTAAWSQRGPLGYGPG